MKLLVFHIGQDRYGLRLGAVQRVLPLLDLKRLPLAPPAVAGLMNLRGRCVPVLGRARLGGGDASAEHVGTRNGLLDYATPEGGVHTLGLLAERVLGVQYVAERALADSGVRAAPFLGDVAGDSAGIVQLVEPERLLPADLRATLFQAAAGAAAP